MPLALIPVGIAAAAGSAAAGLGGALISSSAAKSAAETQAASGDKALALQKQMYDQTRADLQPWVTQGSSAVGTLGALMGLGGKVNGQTVAGTSASPSTASQGATLGSLATPQNTQDMGLVHPAQQNGGEDRMVTIQAPTGETKQMPLSQAGQYLSRGARLMQ